MSTSVNLPAGFLITTLNGKRCTAVPRSLTTITGLTTTTSIESITTTTSTTISETPASSTPAQRSPSVSSPSVAVAAIPVITSSSTTIVNEVQIPTTSPITQSSSSTTITASTTSTSSTEFTTPSPTLQDSTPLGSSTTSTSTSSTQSSVGLTLPNPFNNQNGFPSATETSSSILPSSTSNAIVAGVATTSDSVSRPQMSPTPIVGGVMGGLALVGLVGFLLWLFRRRRRYRRDSLLTPLDGERGSFNAPDRGYMSDEKFSSRFGARVGYQTDKIKDISASITAGIAGFGASLKSKVVRHNSDTPTVNLNRGNSQFLDGPIPQHSRNNSVLSDRSLDHTVKDRFNDWWERLTESVGFSRILRRNRPTTGALSEKQARSSDAPGFSQLIRINERDLQLQVGSRQDIASGDDGPGSLAPNLESFGLSFESNNPFADPILPVASTHQKRNNGNPFMDPIPKPQPPSQVKNTYIVDVRRSRGQPTNAAMANQTTTRSSSASRRQSRYPSTIALNRDSYRDTVFSSMSANGRKGKGRSDPFDLERPELWMSVNANIPANTNTSQNHGTASGRHSVRGTSTVFPDPLRMSSVQGNVVGQMGNHTRQPSTAHSRTISSELGSIYSSGVSSLVGWAGPGPDLGPGSSNTSLRGNASSDGDSHYRSDSGGFAYGQGGGVMKGILSEIDLAMATERNVNNVSPLSINENWDSRRATDNTSPVSIASKSSGGVGKAI